MGFKPGNDCGRYKKNINREGIDAINKEDLDRMYIGQQMTTTEISKVYGCSVGTISKRLKKYNIPTRPPAPKVGHEVSKEKPLWANDNLSKSDWLPDGSRGRWIS